MLDLTHLNENNEAHMVDISGKAPPHALHAPAA